MAASNDLRWRNYDLGGAIAFALAGGATGFTIFLFVTDGSEIGGWVGLYVGAIAAMWSGIFAWRRGRWLVSACGFFLSLAWPAGYFVVLTGPVTIGLVAVALIRAWTDRPTNPRRRAVSVPPAPPSPD